MSSSAVIDNKVPKDTSNPENTKGGEEKIMLTASAVNDKGSYVVEQEASVAQMPGSLKNRTNANGGDNTGGHGIPGDSYFMRPGSISNSAIVSNGVVDNAAPVTIHSEEAKSSTATVNRPGTSGHNIMIEQGSRDESNVRTVNGKDNLLDVELALANTVDSEDRQLVHKFPSSAESANSSVGVLPTPMTQPVLNGGSNSKKSTAPIGKTESSKSNNPTIANNVASLKRSSAVVSASNGAVKKKRRATAKRKAKMTKEQAISLIIEFCDVDTLSRLTMVSKSYKDAVVASKLWRFKTITMQHDLRGHIASINVLLKVSSFVFSGSSDGKIKIWNIWNWQCERTVNMSLLPSIGANQPQAAQQGASVAAARPLSNTGKGRKGSSRANQNSSHAATSTAISNTTTDSQSIEDCDERERINAVTSLAVLDEVLFIGLEDGWLIVRMILGNTNSNTDNHHIKAHAGSIKAIAVNSKNNRVITAGSDQKIHVYDARTYSRLAVLDRHTDVVNCLEICGNRLFSGGRDGNVFVWSAVPTGYTWEKTLEKGEMEKGRDRPMGCVTALTSHENKLYVASWDCHIRIYDAKRLTMLNAVFIWPVGVCWSMVVRVVKNQPTTLVIGVRDGDIELREINKSDTLPVLSSIETENWCPRPDRHQDIVTCVLPLPDGRIVTGADDWSLKVWNYRFAPSQVPASRAAHGGASQNQHHARQATAIGGDMRGQQQMGQPQAGASMTQIQRTTHPTPAASRGMVARPMGRANTSARGVYQSQNFASGSALPGQQVGYQVPSQAGFPAQNFPQDAGVISPSSPNGYGSSVPPHPGQQPSGGYVSPQGYPLGSHPGSPHEYAPPSGGSHPNHMYNQPHPGLHSGYQSYPAQQGRPSSGSTSHGTTQQQMSVHQRQMYRTQQIGSQMRAQQRDASVQQPQSQQGTTQIQQGRGRSRNYPQSSQQQQYIHQQQPQGSYEPAPRNYQG